MNTWARYLVNSSTLPLFVSKWQLTSRVRNTPTKLLRSLLVKLIRSRSQLPLSSTVTTTQVSCHKTTLANILFKCTQLATSFTQTSTQDNTVDRKSTRLNSSHVSISYAVFCLT